MMELHKLLDTALNATHNMLASAKAQDWDDFAKWVGEQQLIIEQLKSAPKESLGQDQGLLTKLTELDKLNAEAIEFALNERDHLKESVKTVKSGRKVVQHYNSI